jgi:hypothetical protein
MENNSKTKEIMNLTNNSLNYSSNNSKLCHARFKFNPKGYWENPIDIQRHNINHKSHDMLALFDQNGYDLTELEKVYSLYNDDDFLAHRQHRFAIKKPWYYQIPEALEGPVLNHCYLFERKGYAGAAREQLESWVKGNPELGISRCPLFQKLLSMKPKWGIDFSMDYVGYDGPEGSGSMIACELFHYEYDSFDFNEAEEARLRLEKVIENTDWNEAAKELLRCKPEWENLSFFEQSDWKCRFFGLPSEQFKMVVWSEAPGSKD